MRIQIEMDMPKSCRECRLATAYKDNELLPTYYVCGYFGRNVRDGNKKEKDCPLRYVIKRVLPTPQQLDKLVQKGVGSCMCIREAGTCYPHRSQIQNIILNWELIRREE